jgi:hypothetical protein
MKSRDIVIVAALLVAGTVLQYFLSMLHTLLIPDIITAFSCLAIILFRPKMPWALGIGILGGGLSMLIPGSLLAPANLISGTAGAYTCFYFYELLWDKSDLAPLMTTFGATLISGVAFVAIVTAVMFGTIIATYGNFGGFLRVYLPIIAGTALLNGILVQVLARLSGRVHGLLQE